MNKNIRARELIADSVAWDNHSCMPLRADDDFLPQISRYREAGITAVTLNIGFDLTSFDENIKVLSFFRRWVSMNSEDYLLIDKADDVLRAKQSGRLGISFDIEGTRAIGNDLHAVQLFYDLGVRWMLMAYNQNNAVAGGCMDADEGLTSFGRDVLDEMKRVGMVPCCSHTGWKSASEVIEYFQGPVIFSHSNAHAVWPHPRNIPDGLIRDCAATGGVVGVNGIGKFLGDNDNSTDAVFRHIDHLVQLVGADHVGLALDYVWDTEELAQFYVKRPDLFSPDGSVPKPSPMVEPERFPEIVQRCFAAGYAREDIRKIIGGNHLRIAQQVWK